MMAYDCDIQMAREKSGNIYWQRHRIWVTLYVERERELCRNAEINLHNERHHSLRSNLYLLLKRK
jgi:hypothetical protein